MKKPLLVDEATVLAQAEADIDGFGDFDVPASSPGFLALLAPAVSSSLAFGLLAPAESSSLALALLAPAESFSLALALLAVSSSLAPGDWPDVSAEGVPPGVVGVGGVTEAVRRGGVLGIWAVGGTLPGAGNEIALEYRR